MRFLKLLFAGFAICCCMLVCLPMLHAQESKDAKSTVINDGSSVEQVAKDLANPLAPITTFATQVRFEFGNGPDDDKNYQLRLQPSFFKPFANQSAFLLRTAIPLRATNWPTKDSGLGDIALTPYFVPDITKSTFFGVGGSVILPTASKDPLGSGRWSAGPAVIFAKVGQPITWGGLVQHVWSFAGDSDRSYVSMTTVQPFLTYLLGNGWASTVNAEVGYNWQAVSTERWSIPVGASIGKVVQIGGQYFNIAGAGIFYAERTAYSPKWEIRINLTYVFK